MATARKTSYLGKVRLLLLLLVLGTPCVVAQEGKSKLRTWTSSIGTKIEAELVSTAGEQVTLKTKAGKTLQVPLNKLSKADQEFIAAESSQADPAKRLKEPAPLPPGEIDAIKKIGGRVKLDENNIWVVFVFPKEIATAELEHLRDLTNIGGLDFSFTEFADAGLEHLKGLAYQKIYQDYYRDENLITKTDVSVSDGTQSAIDTIELASMKKRAWQHDYFTSALPWTQRGPEATSPLGTSAPINWTADPGTEDYLRRTDNGDKVLNFSSNSPASPLYSTSVGILEIDDQTRPNDRVSWDNSNHLSADLSGATASSINDLRRAFRLQEWLERNARGGARYIEIITAHFGVRSSDARLQRPEFLGGSSTPITISEVLQTSANASEPTPQGNMAGHGVSVGSSNYVSYRAEEHGYIIGIMSVMPKTAYQQGVPKHWKKLDKFDYYWPSFANIGEQPIYNEELYHQNNPTDAEVFGYTPRYAEYKYIPSTVHGTFRMLTLKLGQANIPMIVTNHTYDVIGSYVPTKEMGGGSGLKYAASTIIYLSKKKEKDGTEVVGNLIKAKTAKSRLSKENKQVTVRLYYDERGLDKYYGLLELGELGGLWKNVAGRYEIDGKKVYAKAILKDPETYFTPEVMEKLDTIARKEFSYGES